MIDIVDWLMKTVSTGSTRLQVVILCAVLLMAIVYGIKMFSDFIKEFKYSREEEYYDEEDM